MEPRTYLFVPGNRPERFAKALAAGADAIVVDLEDAVVAEAKADARIAVAAWWTDRGADERARIVLRVNDVGSVHFSDDLALLDRIAPDFVILAKAESVEGIAAVRASRTTRVLALIESARGLHHVDAIAAAPGVARLVFGTLDFALDLDLDIADCNGSLVHGAARLVVASRVAGIAAPVAGVTAQIGDDDRIGADLAWERRHGFTAKLCIHPSQVAVVHRAMRPTDEELAWARRVVEADATSPGAARLDGRMIDRPVVLRAERVLARAASH